MSDEQKERAPEAPFDSWMKSMTELWTSGVNAWTDAAKAAQASAPTEKDESEQVPKSLRSALGMWQMLAAILTAPQVLEGMTNAMESLPEVGLKVSQALWEGYFYQQQRWLEKTVRMGEQSLSYNFEGLEENTFKMWTEMYREHFQHLLHVPHLGIARSYQEKASRATDQFNLYQGALAELLYVLYAPLEKSFQVLLAELEKTGKEGHLSGEFKTYYSMWIKILEGHYMTLFKSPEYNQILGRFVTALGNFKVASRSVLEDMLGALPIPTNKEMDEVYKELSLLKKKVKDHDRKLEKLMPESPST